MKLSAGLVAALAAGTAVAANLHRVCSPSQSVSSFPYTGYRIDIQFSAKLTSEVHLYMCKEGRVMLDIAVPTPATAAAAAAAASGTSPAFPWAAELCNTAGTACYKLARRKSFVHRSMPIFFPGTIVGAVFDTGSPAALPLPLVAENFWSQQWLEARGFFNYVYHFPMFYSPSVDDKKHPHNNERLRATDRGWSSHISPDEQYGPVRGPDGEDPRLLVRRAVDSVDHLVTRLARFEAESILSTWGTSGRRFNPFAQLLLLSRVVSKEVLFGLINDIDRVYSKFAEQ